MFVIWTGWCIWDTGGAGLKGTPRRDLRSVVWLFSLKTRQITGKETQNKQNKTNTNDKRRNQ